MQHPFSCVPGTLNAVEATLSSARLGRYLPAAKGDKHLALRLYIWNARLCEAFYLPTQFAEVAARNAIHKPVLRRFGEEWCSGVAFKGLLPNRLQSELETVVREERGARGSVFTVNHVVAGLSFGFWINLLTSSYQNHLWLNGLRNSFPYLPKHIGRQDLYDRLDQLRRFRNKIAHHYAIFDKSPQAEYRNAFELIGWICPESHWLVSELSNLNRVINQRPKAHR